MRYQRAVLPPALLAGARVLRDAIRPVTPKRWGRLRKGILAYSHRRQADKDPAAYVIALTPYGYLVEHGTRYARANPFFNKTVRANAQRASQETARRFEEQAVKTSKQLVAKYGTTRRVG